MGTSSMYSGPNRNPLLPPGYDGSVPNSENNPEGNPDPDKDDNNSQTENNKEPATWSGAKSFMSKIASGNSRNYSKALSKYVKAYGGSRLAASVASSGIRSTSSLGRFISSSDAIGIKETLQRANIEFEGRSAKDILNDVINYLAPIPSTKEESVARNSIVRTMELLYDKIGDENEDISTLEKIDKDQFNILIPIQIESYIYEKLISDLGSRLEQNSSSPAEALKKELDLKEYINSKVETTLRDKDFTEIDFNSRDVEDQIKELYAKCYKVMEDMI
jgi:hypothetical protein